MNFFKSILSDDPDPPEHENPHGSDSESGESSPDSPHKNDSTQQPDHENPSTDGNNAGIWSFGGLINTFATRSESLIETYRRDLKEFGSGLTKETEILREVASRAVKDLPASLEAGKSAAQGSLESVGYALDGVLKSTAEIISKESLFASDGESDAGEVNRSATPGTYSRFEAQLNAIQNDLNTFVEEPEDLDEFQKWKLGFDLGEKKGEIEGLIGENGNLGGVYKKIMPSNVDSESFWCRYFYRVHKLEQQERMRANLVKRANLADEEEELSWDFDDDEDNDDNKESELKSVIKEKGADGSGNVGSSDKSLTHATEKRESSSSSSEDENEVNDSNSNVVLKKSSSDASSKSSEDVSIVEKVKSEDIAESKNDQEMKPQENVVEEKVKSEVIVEPKNDQETKSKGSVVEDKNDEKVDVEEKGDSGKKIDVAMNSGNQSKVDEEDIGWDEIEDTGSDDEKKVSVSSDRSLDLRKRLSVAEDDEDLSWDIEDDDKPMKA